MRLRRVRRGAPLLGTLAVLAALVALAGFVAAPPSAAAPTPTDPLRGEIVVSAAASLTDAFARIARDFRRAHPGVRVRLNLASSSSLVAQIQAGAPVDVFAAADLASFDRLAASGLLARSPVPFARNRMAIVTKPGNPLGIRGVADLAGVPVVALCGRTVPCGAFAATVLARAGVALPETRVTRGADVRETLGAVATGDADAAVVYVTDALVAGAAVTTVRIPSAVNAVAVYGIATVRGTRQRSTADAFVAHVTGPAGRAALRDLGFAGP
jgi:molybdate transport system substrate-binding protein